MLALRLRPGEELLSSLKSFCVDQGLDAAFVATCVGSLQKCTIRLANADRDRPNEIKSYAQRFEITSLVGTVSRDGGAHVHIGLADAEGACIGGHLISAEVFTTAEIVVGDVPGTTFERSYDDATGFPELEVLPNGSADARRLVATAAAGFALFALGLAVGRRGRSSGT